MIALVDQPIVRPLNAPVKDPQQAMAFWSCYSNLHLERSRKVSGDVLQVLLEPYENEVIATYEPTHLPLMKEEVAWRDLHDPQACPLHRLSTLALPILRCISCSAQVCVELAENVIACCMLICCRPSDIDFPSRIAPA